MTPTLVQRQPGHDILLSQFAERPALNLNQGFLPSLAGLRSAVADLICEYAIMIRFGDANWDSPPGFGYLMVAPITISASQRTNTKLRDVAAELVRTGPLRSRG